jgi:glycosyltransferase involved in cell wall biosynthesis
MGMSETPLRILFVSHEATRTGAPRFLLHFLTWLRDDPRVEFEVLLRRGGPMLEAFEALAPVHVLDDRRPDSWPARFEREFARGPLQRPVQRAMLSQRKRRIRHLRDFDLIYLNSAVSAGALHAIPQQGELLISHLHELETGIEHSLYGPGDREQLFGRSDRFVAAADCVADCLVEMHGVPAEKVKRHYEFLDPPAPQPRDEALLARLGIPENAHVVGAMGTVEPRKGPDLFLALAKQLEVKGDGRPVHFIWLGPPPAVHWQWPMETEIRRAHLTEIVHLTGEQPDPFPYLALLDVFVLASREDPYPFACLEAASMGKPIVAFDSGGMSEFLAQGGGFVIPHLHVAEMASRVRELLDDDALRERLGAEAAHQVRRDHDVAVAAPALLDDILVWAGRG